MKSWLRTGLLADVIYLFVFLFNYFFVRSVPDDVIVMVVTAPVYFLLQLFGITSFSVVFFAGILFYFVMGALIDVLGGLASRILASFHHSANSPQNQPISS